MIAPKYDGSHQHVVFRQRLCSLQVKLMERWQENTVTRVFDDYIGGQVPSESTSQVSTGEHCLVHAYEARSADLL